MNLVKVLFGLNGRVGRGTLWLVMLTWAALVLAVLAVGMMLDAFDTALRLASIIYVLAIASGISLGVRRLHDRDKNPLWLLVFYGVPVVLMVVCSLFGGDADASKVPFAVACLQYVNLAILVWALVELGAIRGTIGPNRHGADPIAPKPAPARAH